MMKFIYYHQHIRNHWLFILLAFCFCSSLAYSQAPATVSGKISDGSGTGLPGVTVLVKGTTNGTTTSTDGSYSLAGVDLNGTLIFSFIGYTTKEVPVNGKTSLNVTLSEDVKKLNEVVVIGYGERQSKDVMGAIATMDSKQIEQSPYQSPELAMQGRMSGVLVSSPGGNPNARPTVRIRGVSSMNNSDPLYVVDGIPLYEFGSGATSLNPAVTADIRGNVNILNSINPDDIESISVLKDATAAAIYGVRASNGVVLITTKRGKAGKPKVEVAASKGVQNITRTFDVLNVEQYVKLYQEAYANNPSQALPAEFNASNAGYLGNLPTVDWQKPFLNKNAAIEDYSVRVSGGSEATNYYFSGGYNLTESPLKGSNSERYTVSANVNSNISKYLQTGVNYRLSYVNAKDNSQQQLQYAADTSPWQPIYDPNGPGGFAPVSRVTFTPNANYNPALLSPGAPFNASFTRLFGNETNTNFYAQQAVNDIDYSILRNMGSAFLEIQPVTGLKFRGTVGVDWFQNQRNDWTDRDNYLFAAANNNPYVYGIDGLSLGRYRERIARTFNINQELSANYTKVFGQHNLDVLVNASAQRFRYDYQQLNGDQNTSRDPDLRRITNQLPFIGVETNFEKNALLGYLGRLSYNYGGKYYLDATVRRDASSKFDPDYRWGTFPAASVAWRLSGETFMQHFSWLSDLRLRAGWGQLGNQETRNFAFLSLLSTTPDYSFGSGAGNTAGVIFSGARLPDLAVRDLSWETSETTNIGVDGAFLGNKITFTAEYYNRTVRDILQVSQISASLGVENQPVLNIASVRNSGVEFTAGYRGQLGGLGYNIDGNITTVRNRVTKTFNNNPFGNESGRIEVGQSLNYLWGYKVGGIFQNQKEIDDWKASNRDDVNGNNFKPGDMYFQDINGDGIVNPNDRTFLGKTIPGFYYGLNTGANFKNFDLSLFFQGVGDVKQYNSARVQGESMSSAGVNQFASTLNRWTPENPSTTMPRAVRDDPARNNRFSDRYVEDGSFIRLKNIQVGYTLPAGIKNKLGIINNFRIYGSSTNLFTLTDFSGLDPENNQIPPSRIFTLGVNASF